MRAGKKFFKKFKNNLDIAKKKARLAFIKMREWTFLKPHGKLAACGSSLKNF